MVLACCLLTVRYPRRAVSGYSCCTEFRLLGECVLANSNFLELTHNEHFVRVPWVIVADLAHRSLSGTAKNGPSAHYWRAARRDLWRVKYEITRIYYNRIMEVIADKTLMMRD